MHIAIAEPMFIVLNVTLDFVSHQKMEEEEKTVLEFIMILKKNKIHDPNYQKLANKYL